ncbi:hypothetical protein [Streptomyces sp. NPDC060205]|uniref:hypothetical protein n=1 Tax=Streptomyces sp. NPDC060205 TaxID=3347072 RepID=UPI0036621A54
MTTARRDVRTERFAAHIEAHGLTRARVLEQVDESFGDPLLVVAAGSVIAGFGNDTSDLDLYVVVQDDVASTLPLMSYAKSARIDVIITGAGQLKARHAELSAGAWPPQDISPGDLVEQRKLFDTFSRFGLGLPLDGTPQWLDWQRRLDGEITGWLRAWYAVEAVRMRSAARALAGHKPLAAALRAGEAVIAALERHAVTKGERYFKWKWVGEKLRRLGDRDGLAAFELAMRPPLTADEAPAYLRRAEEVLDTYLSDVDASGWEVCLLPAAGTSWRPFGEGHLVSRWGLRAAAVSTGSPVSARGRWTYHPGEPWHPDVVSLFAEDMLWLGIRSAP